MKNNNENKNNMNISEFIDYKIDEYLKQKEVNELRKAIEEELESFRIPNRNKESNYKCNLDILMKLPEDYNNAMDSYYLMIGFTNELRKLAERYGLGDIDFKMNIYPSIDIDDDWEE